jgi:GT2 family glycosyltransferase
MTSRIGLRTVATREAGPTTGAAGHARIAYAAQLDPHTLLCITTWRMERRAPQPIRGEVTLGADRRGVLASLLPLPAEADLDACSLLALAFQDPVGQDGRIDALVLDDDRQAVHAAGVGPFLVDLQSLVRDGLAARSAATRGEIVDFLVRLPRDGHVAAARGPALRAIRDVLRERRQPSVVAADVPNAVYVEAIHRIDDTGFYIRGWSRDQIAETVRLTAVSPEGERVELGQSAFRYDRPDLDDFYQPTTRSPKAGFLGFFRTTVPSLERQGWIVEMEDAAGFAIEFAAPTVIEDPNVVRTTLLGDLYHEGPGGSDLIRGHIHPAISALQGRLNEGIHLLRVEQFGIPPSDPEVSILVPLYGRTDFLEHQLAQFVHDPEMRAVDLIYLLDSPELAPELLHSAAWAEQLYDVPFRIAISDRNGGFAVANNLAASIAKGRLLLLMNSDVLPVGPGWLSPLVDAHDSFPNVGAVAPRLLYEDGSLQHAGLYFHFDRVSRTWNNEHYYKGLHGSLPAAQSRRRVPAITAACLMISKALYDEMGGLKGIYVQGDYEDSDLCLRLAELGLDVWYIPDVSLYHLEGQSFPSEVRERTGQYNQWLHTELWHQRITAVMAEAEGGRSAWAADPGDLR